MKSTRMDLRRVLEDAAQECIDMEEEKDMNPCHQRWVARTQQHRKTKVQLWGGLVVFTFSNGWNVIVLRDIFELCIHLFSLCCQSVERMLCHFLCLP